MRDALREVSNVLLHAVDGDTLAVFYFAGHGMHFGEQEYLLPTDYPRNDRHDIDRCKAIDDALRWYGCRLNEDVHHALRPANKAILLLGACRTISDIAPRPSHGAPWPPSARDPHAPVNSPFGQSTTGRDSSHMWLIAHGCQPLSWAADGQAGNGAFTLQLLNVRNSPSCAAIDDVSTCDSTLARDAHALICSA
jgi:uncharacterized caspase-like protein